MPGFFMTTTGVKTKLDDKPKGNFLYEEMVEQRFVAQRNTLNKFMQDKAFECVDGYLAILEGYLLNKRDLFQKKNVQTAAQLMREMYLSEGETFFQYFRGSFSGVFYDLKKDKCLIFTNHTGDNPVFYAVFGHECFTGSQVHYILKALQQTKHALHFDEDAAYQLLTFGFMERDNTFAREIRRLRAGTYLCIEQGKVCVKEYHTFHKHPERFEGKSEDEIIDEMDAAFRKAVALEYEKDEEYGYGHLADMSGGLDSRMSAWVAHELKPRHIQLITYSRANYLDETIAKQIAQYWKDELLIKPLDDISFIYQIDEIVHMNDGLSFYMGITGGKRMLESLNICQYGLEHTGMIGDVVIGSYCKNISDLEKSKPSGKYSEKLKNKLEYGNKYQEQFDDHELYVLYTRGFQGMAGTYLIRKNYTEAVSAFMETDFFQLCMDIPLEMRVNHRLYRKWILSKYPKAAKFKWEKTNGLISEPQCIAEIRHIFHRGSNKFFQMMGKGGTIASGMNPIDYWIQGNADASQFWDFYYQEHFPSLRKIASDELCKDVKLLYETGNANEKAMVLTLLSAARSYFHLDEC